jgi:hypothetical protein
VLHKAINTGIVLTSWRPSLMCLTARYHCSEDVSTLLTLTHKGLVGLVGCSCMTELLMTPAVHNAHIKHPCSFAADSISYSTHISADHCPIIHCTLAYQASFCTQTVSKMPVNEVLATEFIKLVTISSRSSSVGYATRTTGWERRMLSERVKDGFVKAVEKADVPDGATTAILV